VSATTGYWECSVCGRGVSKQMGQHRHLRVRRDDGEWDHARCHPASYSSDDVMRQIEQRRTSAGLR
jgi:hypothetical protein